MASSSSPPSPSVSAKSSKSSNSTKKPSPTSTSTSTTAVAPPAFRTPDESRKRGSPCCGASSSPTTAVASTATSPPGSPPKRRRRHQDGNIKVLPKLYQTTQSADLVILISDMLQELVGLNDRIPLSGAGLTRFHSRAPPTISITDYLQRLSIHASLQQSILLSMVYYIDILSTHYPPFVVSSLTVHRFLITAATVASKGLCDTFLTNSFYARVGGISLVELNMLELEFLVRVGWRIVPKPEVLEEYYRSLVMRMGGRYRVEDDEGG